MANMENAPLPGKNSRRILAADIEQQCTVRKIRLTGKKGSQRNGVNVEHRRFADVRGQKRSAVVDQRSFGNRGEQFGLFCSLGNRIVNQDRFEGLLDEGLHRERHCLPDLPFVTKRQLDIAKGKLGIGERRYTDRTCKHLVGKKLPQGLFNPPGFFNPDTAKTRDGSSAPETTGEQHRLDAPGADIEAQKFFRHYSTLQVKTTTFLLPASLLTIAVICFVILPCTPA